MYNSGRLDDRFLFAGTRLRGGFSRLFYMICYSNVIINARMKTHTPITNYITLKLENMQALGRNVRHMG